MSYTTKHKGHKIEITEAEGEDWRGVEGYEVRVKPPFCETAYSVRNYPNKTQALSFAKEAIDNKEIPKKIKLF